MLDGALDLLDDWTLTRTRAGGQKGNRLSCRLELGALESRGSPALGSFGMLQADSRMVHLQMQRGNWDRAEYCDLPWHLALQ